jgi:hypothetical protein
MPFALSPISINNQFDEFSSVLIVPCNICPRMCISVIEKQPYMDILAEYRRNNFFLKYLNSLKTHLKQKGIRTQIFRTSILTPAMCLWSLQLRKRLSAELDKYDAVAVIGCESAVSTVAGAVLSQNKCRIIQMMRTEGIANFIQTISLPFTIRLEENPQGTIPLPGHNK